MGIHFFIFFIWLCAGQLAASEREGAYLQSELSFVNAAAGEDKLDKVLPGTPIYFKARVRNIGNQASAPGEIYVRFVFQEPLHMHQKSLIFQTEKVSLPPIQPNQEIDIAFKTPHQWPSFFDYIREDWPMRYYEAVAAFNGKEQVIGCISVAVSAHYYQGLTNQFPRLVPSL
jgi:hypothetical protein